MRVIAAALVAAAVVCASSPCRAEVVVNGGFGVSSPLFTGNHQFGLGLKGTLGYHPDELPLLIDAGYLSTGEMRDTKAGPKSYFDGSIATLGYRLGLDRREKMQFQARAGWYEGTSEVRAGHKQTEGKTGARGLTAGLGFDYHFLPFIGIGVDLDVLFNVPDFSGPGEELLGDGHSDFFMLSFRFCYGTGNARLVEARERDRDARLERRERAAAQRARQQEAEAARELAAAREREALEAQKLAEAREREAAAARELEEARARERAAATAPSLPPAPPAAAATPPPVAAAAGPAFARGRSAMIRAGGAARGRPVPGSDPVALGDGPVVLGSDIANTTGHWWYVTANGNTGWALEQDLEPVP